MKVIQIGAYMWGAQKIIEEGIHTCAIEKGYSSRILYVCGRSDMPGVIRCENYLENIMTRGLRKLFGKKALFSTLQTLKIIHQLRQFQPDVIHLHVLHGATNYRLLFHYIANMQVPVVYTMHDLWAHTGGCYHTGKCKQYTVTCSSCNMDCTQLAEERKNVKKAFAVKKEQLLKLHNLHCVAVSNWVANEFRKGFLSERPISVIYNGIDCENNDRSSNNKYKEHTKTQIICVATDWNEKKGYGILVDLACLLGKDFEVLLVGNVTDEKKKMNPGNMTFYGSCSDRKALFSLFQNADIHVTASRAETFGMTIVEAAMAGIRSIGFSCTAIGEILKQVYGVAVDECTADALYSAVMELIKQKKCKLSSVEVDRVCECFSVRQMADKYLSLYESMLQ